jgi:hypothetical protein
MKMYKITIHIYSNETGEKIASYTGTSESECEEWADKHYGSNDYHYSYLDVPISNAV